MPTRFGVSTRRDRILPALEHGELVPIIKAEQVLFLNQSLGYITDGTGVEDDPTEPIEPVRVELRPGHWLTLTGTGYNRNLNLQLPSIHEVQWEVPAEGRRWTNRDVTILGFLLGLAPVEFDPRPADGRFPLPSDFITVLARKHGDGNGFTGNAHREALRLVRGLAIQFGQSAAVDPGPLGGGFHAATFGSRYEMFAEGDLDERSRLLVWGGLPDLKDDLSDFVARGPLHAPSLTWPQVGFVMPFNDLPLNDINGLIKASDTRIRVVTPEVEISVSVGATRLRLPVTTTVADLEAELGGPVQAIARTLPEGYQAALSTVSAEVRNGFANGDLELADGRLVLHFEAPDPDIKSLGVVDPAVTPEIVKAGLLVAAGDRVTLL